MGGVGTDVADGEACDTRTGEVILGRNVGRGGADGTVGAMFWLLVRGISPRDLGAADE